MIVLFQKLWAWLECLLKTTVMKVMMIMIMKWILKRACFFGSVLDFCMFQKMVSFNRSVSQGTVEKWDCSQIWDRHLRAFRTMIFRIVIGKFFPFNLILIMLNCYRCTTGNQRSTPRCRGLTTWCSCQKLMKTVLWII